MRIGLYRRDSDVPQEQEDLLMATLQEKGVAVVPMTDYEKYEGSEKLDYVFSIGGDGTLLSAVHQIGESQVPIVGINYGHLGFLTSAGKGDVRLFVKDFLEGRFSVETRSLLHVDFPQLPEQSTYVLNEVYIHRNQGQSLVHTEVYVNDEYVATYQADGVIVATPTGSTAYSLSCGGPILTPNSGCFVITPIAAHTLTLRPIIVPDSAKIKLRTSTRNNSFCVGMDSRMMTMPSETEIDLWRESFSVRLLRMNNQNFFNAIHEKLSWGR